MQMYQGLPIVTNKITPEEQQGIPHHLLNVIRLDEEPWRITQFKQRTFHIIRDIRSRGKLPILVGGTHYYTQSVLFNGSTIESSSEDEQANLSREEIYRRFPILNAENEVIHEKLKEVDPVMAQRWHPKDRRRIQRSLEIFLIGGKKASDVYAEQRQRKEETAAIIEDDHEMDLDSSLHSSLLFWVHSDKEVLNERLDARIDKMVKNGLEEEILSMDSYLHERVKSGITVDRTRGIWISIGWKEFKDYLQASQSGSVSEQQLEKLRNLAIAKTQTATRQYARRQIQWIRHKLIPALALENASHRLYLVDSTDISKWNENVHNPTMSVANAFMCGLEMPSPVELSANAKMHLDLDKPSSADSMLLKDCMTCGITIIGENQWELHLKSRKHRSILKNQGKKAAQEKYMRERKEKHSSEVPPG